MGATRKVVKPAKQAWWSRFKGLGSLNTAWVSRRLVGGVVLSAFLLGGTASLVWFFAQPTTLPIKHVRIAGEMQFLSRDALYEALGDLASAGFFNVDVRGIKAAAEALPWVDRASVRRIWPDALRVEIEEQKPLALWMSGDKVAALVNVRGELFHPQDLEVAEKSQALQHGLAKFSGPKESSLAVARQSAQFNAVLAGVGLTVSALGLNERRAWELLTDNGIHLVLGREAGMDSLARFAAAYPQALAQKVADIALVDLRYTNGFAVQWKNKTQGVQRDAHKV